MPEIQQMVPEVNQRPLMELYFLHLKCVGVDDLMGPGVPMI